MFSSSVAFVKLGGKKCVRFLHCEKFNVIPTRFDFQSKQANVGMTKLILVVPSRCTYYKHVQKRGFYIHSNLNSQENFIKMTNSLTKLKDKTTDVLKGGGEKAVKRHVSKGKLLVRDRINLLLDKSSAFLELSTLAAHDMYDGVINSAGIITGIGRIQGY